MMKSENVAYAIGLMPDSKKDPRVRNTVQVQLEPGKTDESLILEIVAEMTPGRLFKKLFMRGLEIVWGLHNGNLRPLMRWYGSELAEYINALMDARFARIEAHLEQLHRQIEEMNCDRVNTGLKRMDAPPPPPKPVFTVEKNTDIDPAKRFLNSLGIKS